jgi:hypothetical protein
MADAMTRNSYFRISAFFCDWPSYGFATHTIVTQIQIRDYFTPSTMSYPVLSVHSGLLLFSSKTAPIVDARVTSTRAFRLHFEAFKKMSFGLDLNQAIKNVQVAKAGAQELQGGRQGWRVRG